jgi:hypothetical protein
MGFVFKIFVLMPEYKVSLKVYEVLGFFRLWVLGFNEMRAALQFSFYLRSKES